MTKKILIHSLIFSPDGVSTAYLYNDIALRFRENGYEVVVLTTTPHYNVVEEQLKQQPMHRCMGGGFKESNFKGIRVIHVPQKKFKNTLLRLLGFVYWHIVSFFLGLTQRNVDIILSPSPPLTIGVINILLAKLKGCKVIYNVQEIYPDILKKKEGIIVSLLRKMERYVYNRSSAVTTIDKVFYSTIVDRFEDKSKLHIIPNFVDTELYNPEQADLNLLDVDLFPKTESLKLLYAGNIGFAQDWQPLIALAQKTKNEAIEYFIIGEGVMKSYIEEKKKELNLDNIHLLPYQPRNLMPSILSYSDIQFIFMNPEMEMQGFPSKVYTIMACARPLLVCSGEGTPIVNFLQDCDCAKLITEKIFETKVDEMYNWLRGVSKESLTQLGNNGFSVIEKYYTKEVVTAQYVRLVDRLLD
ncbi:glycosyltransferase family 4 protein [Bacteroides neonati]|uniref:glycosyltransferase family 4 protein n=1 Tax=Bacteroides neonati TaxID=1347393 RepID=UPI0004ADFCAB|nr:glycosyltransferase family 4 protein [Bacteroides neonati]